ncbi:MAG TPA: hypothetical protein VEJ63_09095 [Planctomycetota bacterium]|nr:hypothetical protein [Planctomycetota bacterium]
MLTNLLKTTAAATLAGAAFMATPAQAADFSFNIDFGHRPRPVIVHEPVPVVVTRPVVVERPVTIVAPQRRWVPERYETRTEQVLVCPERIERIWVPERVETRRGRGNRLITITHPGFYREQVIPAKYETRTTTVKIPGYWEEVPGCVTPPVCAPAPHCDDDRRGRDNDRWDRRDSGRFERRDNDRGPIVYRSGYTTR